MIASSPASAHSGTPLAELLDAWDFGAPESAIWRTLRDRALRDPLREFLDRPSKMLRARLVELGFLLAGGAPGAIPPELPLVLEALHAGSLIVDDIEDESDERRGAPALHRLRGVPLAINSGNWLYFLPQVLLLRAPLPPLVRLDALERLSNCLLRCHEGQAVDLAVRVWDLPRLHVVEVVRGITARKTACLLELATALGALAAGASPGQVDAITAFGREVGTGLQMLDDLSGLLSTARRHKAKEDLEHGRATWVWAWLSQDLDAEAYRLLVDELREGPRARRVDSLADRLRLHLGPGPLLRARAQIGLAVAALRSAGIDDARCEEVHLELSRLEGLYVEG